jgi:hypothetical protein
LVWDVCIDIPFALNLSAAGDCGPSLRDGRWSIVFQKQFLSDCAPVGGGGGKCVVITRLVAFLFERNTYASGNREAKREGSAPAKPVAVFSCTRPFLVPGGRGIMFFHLAENFGRGLGGYHGENHPRRMKSRKGLFRQTRSEAEIDKRSLPEGQAQRVNYQNF